MFVVIQGLWYNWECTKLWFFHKHTLLLSTNLEKMFLNNSPKWSAVANSRLCSARKPVTLTLAALTSLSRSEPTVMKCCVIGLLLFNKSAYFLEVQCLSKSAFPWCSTRTDLSQIKQNKLCKVFCGCVFLMIPVYFSSSNYFSRTLHFFCYFFCFFAGVAMLVYELTT